MSPIPQVLWTPNLTGQWLMTWNQHPKSRITPSKKFFSFINCLRIVPLTIQGKYRNGWLAASNLFFMFTQSIKFYTLHYQCKCLKNVIFQIDSENGWLLLSASFTAKFGLVFVLTLENAFSQRFHFQGNRKSIGSSKKSVLGIFKIALRLRDRHVFM